MFCRTIHLVGLPNATLQMQQGSVASALTNPADSAMVLPNEPLPQPGNMLSWTINDNTDLLQVGYLGSLTIQELALKLPEPCCVMISLVGSWYFSNQPLPWSIFGTILPGAFSVQTVRVPQLNAPAYLVLRDVTIEYASCDASFAAAAATLISKASAQYEDTNINVISYNNSTIVCNPCLFQGSEQVPSAYSNAVSQVQLYNTNITCLGAGNSSANGTSSNAATAAQHPPPVATAGAAWAPPVWLPVLLAIVTCVFVVVGLTAMWLYLSRQKETAQFSNLREIRSLPDQLTRRGSNGGVNLAHTLRTKSSLGLGTPGVQKSKLSIVYSAQQDLE